MTEFLRASVSRAAELRRSEGHAFRPRATSKNSASAASTSPSGEL
jgi:hypothetical protein